jgi:hypothetical protein
MKIFIGYGYNPRDAWIEDLVFRVIRAFNDEPVHGKETYGNALDAAVCEEIQDSDAMIGFRTRREQISGNMWKTHPWVDDELLVAANHSKSIPVLEVRESLVEEPAGMLQQKLQGMQRINCDEQRRDYCLVEIAQALGRWHRQRSSVQFTLLPEEFAPAIRPLLRNPDLRCVYRILNEKDTDIGLEKKATIHRLPRGQMAIRTAAIPENASIMVEVWMGQRQLLWSSDLQPVDSRTIQLEKAPS